MKFCLPLWTLQCLRDEEVKKITEECTQQKSAFEVHTQYMEYNNSDI